MNASDRNTIEAQLPLYVNGQLDAEERRRIEAALTEEPALADEVEFLQALKETLQQQPGEAPPVELGLARLKRDIQREATEVPSNQAEPRRYWKPLALAACLLLVVQTGFQLTPEPTDSDWAPLSGESTLEAPRLHIAFQDTATAEQIRESLGSREARIVDGPGPLGLYTVQLPADSDIDAISRELGQLSFIEEVSSP